MRGSIPRKPLNSSETSFASRMSPYACPGPGVPTLEQYTRKRSGSIQTSESVSPIVVLGPMPCAACVGRVQISEVVVLCFYMRVWDGGRRLRVHSG